jgi:phosphatidylglycerol---prolipoprotein diacylglyceryl transferase
MVGDDFGAVVPEALQHLPFPITVTVPDPLPEGSLFGSANAGQVLWGTQMWMSFNALILGFIAWRILKKRRYTGQVTLWALLIYSITRYTIENFRGDEIRGLWFGGILSTSQLISIVAGLFALVMLVRCRHQTDPPATPVPKSG